MNRNKPWSLVLGGGAARGLTYLGIYKRLEEHDYYPTEIVGNSVGAIIGALISMGISFDQIYNIAKDIHWKKLVDIRFRGGLLGGKKVLKIFDSIFGETIFDEINIPFKTITVDLNTCKKVVISDGKIKNAVRASMSIPLLFPPLNLNGSIFVDGGIASNLPIEETKSKQVLAVSSLPTVETPIVSYKEKRGKLRRKGFFGLNSQISYRVLLSVLFSNEEKSLILAKIQKKDLTILKPTPNRFKLHEFHKVDEMVEIGYQYMVDKFGK